MERFDPEAPEAEDWKSLMALDPSAQKEVLVGLCRADRSARESPALTAAVKLLDSGGILTILAEQPGSARLST